MLNKQDILDNIVYCPICKGDINNFSEYLFEVFADNPHAYEAAILVTHYRHNHIRYYDSSWQSWSYALKNKEYSNMSHEEYRILVNNRAKRQLIRNIVIDSNLDNKSKKEVIKGFSVLQNNDDNTFKKIKKSLISIEMNDKKCNYCERVAKYLVKIDHIEEIVCGIHKRKREFKEANIAELKDLISKKVDEFLLTN